MTSNIQTNQGTHDLKADCLSFGEVLAQSFAVIAPTTIPGSNIGAIAALSGNGAWLSFLIGLLLCGFANFSENSIGHLGIHPSSITAIGAALAWYAAYKDIQLSAVAMLGLEGASLQIHKNGLD